jgi:5S rRNA maturation endonuclease (ribonuclease M5)
MRYNFILKLLDRYRAKNMKIPIIVEGKNDVESLRRLSFSGEILTVTAGLPLVSLSERISESYEEIIILTDFDRKGREIQQHLSNYLNGSGCRTDTYLWEKLKKYMPVRTVEELPYSIERVMDRTS